MRSTLERVIVTLGMLAAPVLTMTLASVYYEKQIAKRDALIQSLEADSAAANARVANAVKEAGANSDAWEAQFRACQGSLLMAKRIESMNEKFYTVLYEETPPAAAPSEMAQFVGMVNPQLAKIVAALQAAQQPQQAGHVVRIRWIVPGHGAPLLAPPNSRVGTYRFDELANAPKAVTQ